MDDNYALEIFRQQSVITIEQLVRLLECSLIRSIEEKVKYTANRHNFTFLIPHPNPPPLGEGVYEKRRLCQFAVYLRKEIASEKDYAKMIEQIDKYWDKLFADPITVCTSTGRLDIQPQRANNIIERIFRDLKRGSRKDANRCLRP